MTGSRGQPGSTSLRLEKAAINLPNSSAVARSSTNRTETALCSASSTAMCGDGNDVSVLDRHVIDVTGDGPCHETCAMALAGLVIHPARAQLEAVAGFDELARDLVRPDRACHRRMSSNLG
jgi:hypothetical protein